MGPKTTVNTGIPHGFTAGDYVILVSPSRLEKIRTLLVKPRKTVVVGMTATEMEIQQVRMTWNEWFRAIWATIRG